MTEPTLIEMAAAYAKRKMSRPGAKAKMGRILQPHEATELQEFLESYGVTKYDIVKSIGQIKVSKSQVGKALDAIAALNSEIQKEGIGGKVVVDVVPFSRPGAKAKMAIRSDDDIFDVLLEAQDKGQGASSLVSQARRLRNAIDPHGHGGAAMTQDSRWPQLVRLAEQIQRLPAKHSRPGAKSTHAALPPQTLEAERRPGGGSHSEAVSRKIATLINEGKPQDQAVAIALDLERRGEL